MIMKNILITGGTGFLGSHLVHGLLENNHQVILLKRSTSNIYVFIVFYQIGIQDAGN
jgi:nucleoside-diphosphate-sugar epimerase